MIAPNMHGLALWIGDRGIGLALLLAALAGTAFVVDRLPRIGLWLEAAAQLVVCTLPLLLAVLAAFYAYPDRPARALLAIAAGAALTACILAIVWRNLRIPWRRRI